MMDLEKLEKISQDLYHERLINKILTGENEELKKINKGIKMAYDDLKWMENEYLVLVKYKKYIPYIDKFRKSMLFRIAKKIKNIFKRGSYE